MKARHLELVRPAERTRCLECGHLGDYHRTANGHCTGELYDRDNNAWMRCACERWRG